MTQSALNITHDIYVFCMCLSVCLLFDTTALSSAASLGHCDCGADEEGI
jgi:hypothetical protein